MTSFIDYLEINKEVLNGLRGYKPIVALESSVITHKIPYPENIESALSLEEIIRKNGAIPATMGIVKGRIKIGLNREETEYLASSKDIIKTGRSEIPYVVAMGLSGGTTVAAAMFFSQLAGIRVLAAGEMEEALKEADKSPEVSSNLTELSNANVTVVCNCIKAMPDMEPTLEKLEALGVPVIGYGTGSFSDINTKGSVLKVPMRADNPRDLAKIMKTKWDLKLDGGIIVTNPIPNQHKSCKDNIALIKSNAALASLIAVEYARLENRL